MLPGWLDANLLTVINGLAVGSLLFLIASGLSLIYGQAGVLNLAHGTFFMVGAYLGHATMAPGVAVPEFVLYALLVAVVGVIGGLGLAVAIKPLVKRGHLDQALLTLGLALVGAEVVRLVWGEDVHSVPPPSFVSGVVDVIGRPFPQYRLFVIAVSVVAAVALWLAFERTRYGATVRAGVQDPDMLAATGVNPNLVITSVFALGGALAMVSGFLGAPVLGARPGLDNEVLILALIVVVIGGLGSAKGALVGALIIGQLQVLGIAHVPDLAPFILFAAMGLTLVLKPSGLVGRTERRHA